MNTPTEAERAMTDEEIQTWLRRHRAVVGSGINVGLIQKSKARRLESILIRRSDAWQRVQAIR